MVQAIELFTCPVTATELPRLEASYIPRLHSAEQARYRLFAPARRRLEWLAGRALTLEALKQLLGRINAEALRTGSAGNIVYTDAPLTLSLSHSHGLLALAVAAMPVGVDVERLRSRSLMAHAERVFMAEEAAHLARTRDDIERLRLFYRYWTLTEAVGKAAGISIWEGLAASRFDLAARTPGFICTKERLAGPWRFWFAGIDVHWQLAVAARGAPVAAALHAWRIPLSGVWTKQALDGFSSFSSP
ncbi:MAG: 4'-phosphopantetheinyl transferase family protein [Gammaproteobacteria bacterium]